MMFPHYHDEYNWWSYTSDKRGPCDGIPGCQTLELIDELVEKIPAVDGDRVYIMGMSQGGFGIPYLVTAYPNRFAAQILIAGMTYSVPWSGQNMIPSWLIYSKDDPVMNQNGTDIGAKMTEVLECVGSAEMIKVTIYEDVGHGSTLKRAIEEAEWLPWLFQQRNENEPKSDSGLMDAHFN